jgi:hypothetical protein
MIEISAIVFSLLIEAYVILLIGVGSWFYFVSKKKKNDRNAALKLVDQIKHQSEARLSSTRAFLKDKYSLEGPKLKKAIALIDKSEKHFFQKVIDIYLNRDAEALSSLDAEVAALIDTYKSLTPAIKNESEKDQQIELLQAANAQLTDELAITNKTMSDMIAEFGNMFGGGSDNELQQTEVVEKVIAHHQEDLNNKIAQEEEDLYSDETDIETDDKSEEVTSEDDIDDILNGVISSDNK